ncbi:MAG: hypothetical protein HKN21_15870 [Candidatus Eisenbacteria bacterium]|uniref:Uncharacterized protein n=1 Tax=Eiseniibacteriota bacterium TaxID=2212470 RepID=A0A7Y2H3N1_UNCEI|nr:hypothetical protein [Candidatus Eisenbacteria bacterium]
MSSKNGVLHQMGQPGMVSQAEDGMQAEDVSQDEDGPQAEAGMVPPWDRRPSVPSGARELICSAAPSLP